MLDAPGPVRCAGSCGAVVIPTHGTSPGAILARLFHRLVDAVATWRRDRHDARYLGYLGDTALKEIGLSRSALLAMGIDAQSAQRSDQQGFPF
jgi:uncharacterized protein YjiS (DUF1127 family)